MQPSVFPPAASARRPLAGVLALTVLLTLLLAGGAARAQTITGFSPASGASGSTVTISGSGFTSVSSVRFGELSAVFTVNSSSQITAVVPRAASTQPINVTTSTGYALTASDFAVTRSSSLTYSLVSSSFAAVAVGSNAAPTVADLDGDGKLDLLVGRADGTVSRYEQSAVNGLTWTSLGSLSDGSATIDMGTNSTVSIVDANGDGRFSVMLGRADGLVYEYEQGSVGASTFALVTTSLGGISTTTNSSTGFTDLTGDGVLEIIVGKGDNYIGYFGQNGVNNPGFYRIDSNYLSLTSNEHPFCVDLDGNGLIDVLFGVGGGGIYRFEQSAANSNSLTQLTTSFNGISAGSNAKPCVTDIDGDGLLDLLVGRADGTIDRYEQGTAPNAAPTNISLSPASVAENQPVGTTVGTLGSTDPNAGNTFTYTFATGGTDNGSFNIASGNTLTTNGVFNYEVKNSYSIKIRSTDQGGLYYEKVLPVSVSNIGETPTVTSFTPTSGPVGTSVTISGTRFQDAGAVTVRFNGTVATGVSVSSNTQLTAPVPSGATTGTISVQNADGTGTSSGTFTVTVPAPNTTIVSGPPALTNNSTVSFQFSSDQSPVDYTTSGVPNASYTGNGANSSFGPVPDGSYTLSVAAHNTSTGLTDPTPATYSFTVDTQGPVATLASTAGASTRTAPIPVTLTFSESVTGFALSDLTVSGGTAGSLTGSGASYAFTITPSVSGNPPATITVALAANRASDAAGNGNLAAASLSRTYDTQVPTVTISGPGGNTSTSPIGLTVVFSEPVTGFALTDLTVGGGTATAGSLSGSGTTYTLSITPGGAGTVTVSAVAGAAQDAATNNSTVSNTYSVAYAPAVTVTSIVPTATPTNASTATFTVTFSGSVTGVTSGSFSLTASGISGASITGIAGTGTTRTLTVNTGSGDGTLRLDLSTAAGIVPTVSNAPYTSGTLLTVDKTAPVGTVGSGAPNPTNTSPISFNVTFPESVTGFALSDLTVTNGTAGALTGSGGTYGFSITPTAPGSVSVQLNANSVTDAAGNPNAVSNTLTRIYDNAGPTAALATTAGSATRTSPIPVTVTFSEATLGFALTDLSLSGGTAANLTGGPAVYSFTITPGASGTPPTSVSVLLPAGRATDFAGNGNTASNTLVISYDTQAPTVSISTTAPEPTNTAPIPVTVTFSEAVAGFALSDVTVGNGTAGSLTGSGSSYSFTVTPAANGVVTIQVNASAAQDAAGNNNVASNSLSRTYDNQGPTVTLSGPAGSSSNAAAFSVTATFSQAVAGFALTDITVSGGVASALTGSGTTYTFTITASGTGSPASAVTVSLAANVVVDGASNGNSPSNTLSRTFDTVAPTVALSTAAAASTSTAAFAVTALFSEPVTGFALTDITVTNGTASALTGSGASYSFTVTASGSGNPASAVTVSIGSNKAADAATNPNTASNTLTHTFDTQAPAVALSSTASNPTASSPIPVTVTFSEAVTGFTLSDVTVGNGAASNLTGSGASYTFSVTPAAPGPVTVDLAAGDAQDAAGNANVAAAQLTRTYQPAASITGVGPGQALTNAATVTFGVTTTAPVTGWSAANFSLAPSGVSGASITGVTASGNTAIVTVSTGSGDGSIRLDVPTATGLTPTLSNVPYTGGTAVLDRTAPTVSGVADGVEYNTNRTITFADAHAPTATLNGAPFTSGTVVSVEDSYTLEVTDAAGNVTTLSFVLDKTPPSTLITAGPGVLTNDATPSFSFDSPDGGVLYTTTGGPGLSYPNNGPNSTFGPLADGTYTLTVAAVDAAGNADPTPETYTFTVDTQAPNTSITAQPADPTTATTAHFEFAATEAGSTFEAALDGGLYAPANPAGTDYSSLAEGSHTLTVRATDPAGNEDASPASYTWRIVPSAPTLTAISPAAELPGVAVTLTGTNFTSTSTVSFGGVAASVTFVSATSLTAVVPAGAATGSSAVLVTTATGSNASAPAFEVLAVYPGPAACLATAGYLTTGDGEWHYLRLPTGEVVAALRDDNSQLGTVAADFTATGSAQPVRQDGRGQYYLDRSFHLTATSPTFAGSSVPLRFYGLASELARLQAADASLTPASLKLTQYSGANEDCELGNDDFATGEFRVLAAPATVPGNGVDWFVSEVSVADHFSEFFLTGSATPLPVQLAAFAATAAGPAAVRLTWATTSEKNSARFDVERSRDGTRFAHIGTVAAAGGSSAPRSYELLDSQLPSGAAQLYYRLRQVDRDGTASYSPVRAVELTTSPAHRFTIFPVPARAGQPLAVAGLPAGAPVQLLDALGRLVVAGTADAAGTAQLALPSGLAAGIYVVRAAGQACQLPVVE